MDFLYATFGFILTIGILVSVHEFGHYWVARRLGIKVLRFAIGFGKPLWKRRFGPDNTEYIIGSLPFGGYVKMLDEREGKVAKEELPRAFNRQSLPVRVAVVSAGSIFNIVFAVFAYWVMFVVGINGIKPSVMEVIPNSIAARADFLPNDTILSVDDMGTPSWETAVQAIATKALMQDPIPLVVRRGDGVNEQLLLNLSSPFLDDITENGFFHTIGIIPPSPYRTTVIGEVKTGGAAKRAGLKKGDRIISANGQPLADWNAWRTLVRRHPGQDMEVHLERDGLTMTLILRPDPVKTEAGAIGFIGAAPAPPTEQSLKDYQHEFYTTERYSPFAAFGHALDETGHTASLTLRMIWKILTLDVSFKNLNGPVSIAQYAGAAVQTGLSKFLQLLGILSVSIGVLNLLPIPILDGGHVMYYCIEFVKKQPLSEKAQSIGNRIGITMLVGLMGLALFNDFARLLGI
uniref:Zinc metalloprotease n=2 Tax=unclassified Candidatus Kentrum TaxID=2643149 RepID=A0A451AR10_9GAMM|nr:MAG: regulator of sigma E protease [Candidatus Kentron sp. LPFa]VFK22902.1 MAG: regulator of sigma E protease [Candidatus Kentron sp. LPFa]VFK66536.1 MAG: regulator of sigma E protease [Candidatus Kentron sp. UNK]VFK68437.1 MAG: regulator of sigma E protease [Candidatus Kentron sp. UNK]